MRNPRLLGMSIALVLVAGVVGAFTKDEGGGQRTQTVAALTQASDRARAAGTARMEFVLEAEGGGGHQTANGSGAFDFGQQLASFHMEVPALGALDLVSSGATLYLQFPTTGGWVRIDMTGELAGEIIGAVGGQDPLAALDQLRSIADVEDKGPEVIRGTEVTRYSGPVDFAAALEQSGMPQDQIDQFNAIVESEDLDVTATIDAYVDADGLVHRVVTSLSMSDLFDMTATMDLLDFGAPVEIVIPAPEAVVRTESAATQAELFQLMQALTAG